MEAEYGCKSTAQSCKDKEETEEVGDEWAMAQVSVKGLWTPGNFEKQSYSPTQNWELWKNLSAQKEYKYGIN